ncbi:MAG: peptidylprolyl isomerase [Phycisphaeraceae bacterium]|nr:MAG: peptidylprolyl isomerase [Phycisphaeraceae bacterium]
MTQFPLLRAVRHAVLCFILLAASVARAQLTPNRLYYGVNRTMPMTVKAGGGDVEIRLWTFGGAEPVAKAAAMAGGVDLAALFPVLWSRDSYELLYAQLYVDQKPVGPAVVLDPMVTVDKATIRDPNTMSPIGDERRGRPVFDSDFRRMTSQPDRPGVYSGIRAYVDKDVMLETSLGDIRIRLRPDEAPNSAWNFRQLAEGGFYTDIIFHRIVPAQAGRPGFVVQVGDPTGEGSGGPGYQIDLENSKLPHDFGVLSMARNGNDPDSNGSQVFICLSREATAALDGRYTAFGQAISGADTIAALGNVKVNGQTPVDPPVLKKAYLVDAAPFGTGAPPVTAPGGTAAPAGQR